MFQLIGTGWGCADQRLWKPGLFTALVLNESKQVPFILKVLVGTFYKKKAGWHYAGAFSLYCILHSMHCQTSLACLSCTSPESTSVRDPTTFNEPALELEPFTPTPLRSRMTPSGLMMRGSWTTIPMTRLMMSRWSEAALYWTAHSSILAGVWIIKCYSSQTLLRENVLPAK